MSHGGIADAALIATLAGPGLAAAAPEERPIAATVARLLETKEIGAIEAPAPNGPVAGAQLVGPQPPRHPGRLNRPRQSRALRAVLGGAVGAVGGALAGGYLGAKSAGDCGGCDDPGLKGFLIGFPVGGIVGGVLGAKHLFR